MCDMQSWAGLVLGHLQEFYGYEFYLDGDKIEERKSDYKEERKEKEAIDDDDVEVELDEVEEDPQVARVLQNIQDVQREKEEKMRKYTS